MTEGDYARGLRGESFTRPEFPDVIKQTEGSDWVAEQAY